MCSCLVLVLGNPHLPSPPLLRLRIGATASLGGTPFRCGQVIMIAMSSLSEIRYTLGVWLSFLTIPDQISSESNQLVKSDSLEVLGRVHSWSRNIEHSRHSAAAAPHTSRFWKGPICLGFFFLSIWTCEIYLPDMWNISSGMSDSLLLLSKVPHYNHSKHFTPFILFWDKKPTEAILNDGCD